MITQKLIYLKILRDLIILPKLTRHKVILASLKNLNIGKASGIKHNYLIVVKCLYSSFIGETRNEKELSFSIVFNHILIF